MSDKIVTATDIKALYLEAYKDLRDIELDLFSPLVDRMLELCETYGYDTSGGHDVR